MVAVEEEGGGGSADGSSVTIGYHGDDGDV